MTHEEVEADRPGSQGSGRPAAEEALTFPEPSPE
jgi:hypothetical protein